MSSDLRTKAIVLRRVNYGESDRILTFLTPEGKNSALARGVRKEKSRLAGSIELFSVTDIVVHQGRADLATLTSAKMLRFYGNILTSLSRLELASSCLKRIERFAEQTDNPEFFTILEQVLAGLDGGYDNLLVQTWFNFQLLRASGEELNFIRDVFGQDLQSDLKYNWDFTEQALRPDAAGYISAREIKLVRILWSNKLRTAHSIENATELLPTVAAIAQNML